MGGVQATALAYVRTENALAVLSDLQSNTSRIYNGRTAVRLGLAEHTTEETIASIWEEKIFDRIHPDDLLEKHTAGTPLFRIPARNPDCGASQLLCLRANSHA